MGLLSIPPTSSRLDLERTNEAMSHEHREDSAEATQQTITHGESEQGPGRTDHSRRGLLEAASGSGVISATPSLGLGGALTVPDAA